MKRIKNYTSIWNVEKMIYALSDVELPVPLTLTQIGWFTFTMLAVMIFKNVPPISLTDNVLIKYGLIPVGVTWFMSQKTFDGMKPYNFLKSVVSYLLRPKETYMGNPVKTVHVAINETITTVRSEVREPETFSNKIHRE